MSAFSLYDIIKTPTYLAKLDMSSSGKAPVAQNLAILPVAPQAPRSPAPVLADPYPAPGSAAARQQAAQCQQAAQVPIPMDTESDDGELTKLPVVPVPGPVEPIQTIKSLKIQQPNLYHGDRDKLRAWLYQINMYMRFQIKDQVCYASTFLWGKAWKWYKPFSKSFLGNPKKEWDVIFTTPDLFKQKITQVFGDIDKKQTTEQELFALSQKGSVANYTMEFQRTAASINWDDEALIAQYYQGLKDNIKDRIVKRDWPDKLDDMIKKAIVIDNQQYKWCFEKTQGLGKTSTGQDVKPHKSKHHYKHCHSRNQNQEVSATQITKNNKQGKNKSGTGKSLCYNCGKAG